MGLIEYPISLPTNLETYSIKKKCFSLEIHSQASSYLNSCFQEWQSHRNSFPFT